MVETQRHLFMHITTARLKELLSEYMPHGVHLANADRFMDALDWCEQRHGPAAQKLMALAMGEVGLTRDLLFSFDPARAWAFTSLRTIHFRSDQEAVFFKLKWVG